MNDFAIETVQSLFENMLDVPQSELETTVMRFREEVKNLGEPERFAVTGDLVLRVQQLAWELGTVSTWIIARLWTNWSSICWISKAR